MAKDADPEILNKAIYENIQILYEYLNKHPYPTLTDAVSNSNTPYIYFDLKIYENIYPEVRNRNINTHIRSHIIKDLQKQQRNQ